MSYILDALRKSEQERQIAAGGGVGMLYPAPLKHAPNNTLRNILLGGAGLLAAAVLAGGAWRTLSGPAKHGTDEKPAPSPTLVVPPTPPAITPPAAVAEVVAQRRPAPAQKPPSADSVPLTKMPITPNKMRSPPLAGAGPEPLASLPNSVKPEASGDLPKGLPPMNISGYINDEQGANLAIINDKLVREGEEVAPGLRLEKIVGENAVFSYKGQRFRR